MMKAKDCLQVGHHSLQYYSISLQQFVFYHYFINSQFYYIIATAALNTGAQHMDGFITNFIKITVFLLDIINDIRIEPLEAESEIKSYSQSYKKKRYILFLRTITRRPTYIK